MVSHARKTPSAFNPRVVLTHPIFNGFFRKENVNCSRGPVVLVKRGTDTVVEKTRGSAHRGGISDCSQPWSSSLGKSFSKVEKKKIFRDPNVLHFEFDFSDIFRPALVLVCLVLQG